MDPHIRFIDHQGKKILLVDFSNCPADELEKVARRVPDYVTSEPLGSVLVLTDFTGAKFDRDAIRAIKETAVFDKPFVKKSALVGIEGLPASFHGGTEKLLAAGHDNFQDPGRSFGLADCRFGGCLSRLRHSGEEPAKSEKARKQ